MTTSKSKPFGIATVRCHKRNDVIRFHFTDRGEFDKFLRAIDDRALRLGDASLVDEFWGYAVEPSAEHAMATIDVWAR